MDILRLRGVGVSPGIALAEAFLTERVVFSGRTTPIPPARAAAEIQRFRQAADRTREELVRVRDTIQARVGEEHAFIFDAHLLILDDPTLKTGVERKIRDDHVSAESALTEIHSHYARIFDALPDETMRLRKSDVTDVMTKLYRNLAPDEGGAEPEVDHPTILVAHDLLPSEAAVRFSQGNVLAVAMDMGGPTSHAAILARSMNIPTVVGLHDITQRIRNGDILIVDGTDGEVIVNPPPAVRKEFQSKKDKYDAYRRELRNVAKLKSATRDDVRFFPMANIELPEEIHHALSYGAEGVGLFRSEFIYLQRDALPTEEEHFAVYSKLAKDVYPHPVYIRTIDIGGDKSLPILRIQKEPNPALGLRAIRFSLKYREIFRVQLRAILRASAQKNIRVTIPMITEIEEIGEIKLLFAEVKAELAAAKIPFDPDLPLGIMIEVPAAAALTDILVKEVDFLSIGTNDLIQYYLAADRSNEDVAYLYKPLHPSVLRLLRFVIETADRAGKEVAVCGEMAADPLPAMVLLGLGLRRFSMNPIFIPRVKKALRAVEAKTVRRVVHQAMALKSAQEVEEFLIEKLLIRHPEAFLQIGLSS
ncbi:MAG: phosphoenolpyruvate--protein phosphotransferase [Candidatus Aminicenantes bacterium]|nr:phosphoenolpyruvate--protein phosphotransferase [Candidatus Aminicenantes bacterium]